MDKGLLRETLFTHVQKSHPSKARFHPFIQAHLLPPPKSKKPAAEAGFIY